MIVDDQGLDEDGLLAAVCPVGVPAGRSDQVGSPHYGEVTWRHAGGGLLLGQVVQVTHQAGDSLEVVVGQTSDGLTEQPGVLMDRLPGDLHHPVVQTVGQQGVGQRTEKELNIKL